MPLPAALHTPLLSLIQSLLSLQTTAGAHSSKRFYSFLFRDLPDRRLYADYYSLIREPRSLHGVLVRSDEVDSYHGVVILA